MRRLPLAHSARHRGRRPTVAETVADNSHTKEDEQVARHIILYAEGATVSIIGSDAVVQLPVPLPERHRRRRKTVTMATRARTVNKTSLPTSQADQDVAGTVVDSAVVIVNK